MKNFLKNLWTLILNLFKKKTEDIKAPGIPMPVPVPVTPPPVVEPEVPVTPQPPVPTPTPVVPNDPTPVVPTPVVPAPAPAVDPLAGLIPSGSISLGTLEVGAVINKELVAPCTVYYSATKSSTASWMRASTFKPGTGQPILTPMMYGVALPQGMNGKVEVTAGNAQIMFGTTTGTPQKFVFAIRVNNA